jgi:hypothetical protein
MLKSARIFILTGGVIFGIIATAKITSVFETQLDLYPKNELT